MVTRLHICFCHCHLLVAMNPPRSLFLVAFLGLVSSNNLRGTAEDNKLSFLETFLSDDVVSTVEPISTLSWSTIGTDEPATFYTTTVKPTGNDITTVDPNTLIVKATVEGSTVSGDIPASEDLMNMCNCASANLSTLLGCDPPLTSCTHD